MEKRFRDDLTEYLTLSLTLPDSMAALVQFVLPPVDKARSPYQVPSPESSWPILQLPLNAMSLHGVQSGEEREYARDVYMYHLFNNVATSLARSFDRQGRWLS